MLTPGSDAPDFTLPGDHDGDIRLSDLRGGPVIVYFYPKDNTPGCTTQAIDFSAAEAEFAALGAKVLGISKDSLKKHANFRAKHELTVTLLSDEDSDVCERYGVWKEKKMYGKTFLGIERTTVLVDADGKIARVWPKVKVSGHVAEVLAAAKDL
jgi:peroxiredoxin Q/BCP